MWKKDILRLEKKNNSEPVTLSHIQDSDLVEIEDLVKDEIYFLEHLAFTGMLSEVIDFESRHRTSVAAQFRTRGTAFLLDKTLPRLSFLRTSDPSAERSSRSYHFLHLTFQEYFAARYFARQWMSGEQLTCLKFGNRQGRTNTKPQKIDIEEFLQEEKYNAHLSKHFLATIVSASHVSVL